MALGPSGLLRDYMPELDYLFLFMPIVFKQNPTDTPVTAANSHFAHYFSGLFEGDGTITVPKRELSDKGRLYYPSLELCFSAHDFPLAMLVQQVLGCGSLSKIYGKNAYNLAIKDRAGVLLVFSLLNGKLRTAPKVRKLAQLADWLNVRDAELGLVSLPASDLLLSETAWFSGFADADGHFSANVTAKTSDRHQRVRCAFELVQSSGGEDTATIMQDIADFLGVSLCTAGREQYRIRTSSVQQNKKLEQYFSTFPLFSAKRLDYQDWLLVVAIFENKTHNTPGGVQKIKEVIQRMNSRRTDFV